MLKVDVKYKNHTGTQTFYAVAGQVPSLLGHEWLRDIRLDGRSLEIARVAQPLNLKALIRKYEQLFQEGLGMMKDLQAKSNGTTKVFSDQGQDHLHSRSPWRYNSTGWKNQG